MEISLKIVKQIDCYIGRYYGLLDILIIDTVPKNVFIIKTKVLLPQAYVTLAEFGYSA